ncbi:Cytochrome P450 monooxygenase mpaDE, partial [Lachnellula suecica]
MVQGPVTRLGPNEVVIEDLYGIRRSIGARSQYTKSNWYTSFRFDPQRDNLLTERDNKIHDRVRAKMKLGYSGQENLYLEETVDLHLNEFADLISAKYLCTSSVLRPLDLAQIVQYFTMDAITHLAFGKEFGFLAEDGDVYEYVATIKSMLPFMNVLSVFPRLHAILRSQLVKKLFLPSDKDSMGVGKIIGVAKSVIAERFKPDAKDQKDMLGSFVRHGLTQEELEPEVLLQIVAGSDTTATAIRAVFLHLMTSPCAYSKICAEIRAGSLSTPISEKEAKSLPYLQAVIREGLRLWPPIASAMFKLPPPGGDTIAGFRIPEGTKVGIAWYKVGRKREIYGEDADVFRPERWLEADAEKLERMERTNDLFFAPGRWGCLGKGLAILVLNK